MNKKSREVSASGGRGGRKKPRNPVQAHPEHQQTVARLRGRDRLHAQQQQPPQAAGPTVCCVCLSEKHRAKQCIRANAVTGQLMACTVCNSRSHPLDRCLNFRQMGFDDKFRVLVTERIRLPSIYTENRSVLRQVLSEALCRDLPILGMPWLPDAVRRDMDKARWHPVARKYEATLDASGHKDDDEADQLVEVLSGLAVMKRQDDAQRRARDGAVPAGRQGDGFGPSDAQSARTNAGHEEDEVDEETKRIIDKVLYISGYGTDRS